MKTINKKSKKLKGQIQEASVANIIFRRRKRIIESNIEKKGHNKKI